MKLKELESWLSQCESFRKPKVEYEQYATSAHIASRMLYSAQKNIQGGIVCDLGSGCGILSIGSVMLEAGLVYGFEIDEDAIDTALANVHEVLNQDEDESPPIQLIQCQIQTNFANNKEKNNDNHDDHSRPTVDDALTKFDNLFDVVIMNPPFGTKNNAGADFGFLRRAAHLIKPGGHIYSLHKTSTRPFFEKKLQNSKIELDFPLKGQVLAEIRYDLPKCYKFHKEKSVDIEVDFWHFEKLP